MAMPTSRWGRICAVLYVAAVLGATVAWIVQGAYSASMWLTWGLTLPWSYIAEGLTAIAAMALGGNAFGGALVPC